MIKIWSPCPGMSFDFLAKIFSLQVSNEAPSSRAFVGRSQRKWKSQPAEHSMTLCTHAFKYKSSRISILQFLCTKMFPPPPWLVFCSPSVVVEVVRGWTEYCADNWMHSYGFRVSVLQVMPWHCDKWLFTAKVMRLQYFKFKIEK